MGESDNKVAEMRLRLRDAQGKTREERIGPDRTEVLVGRRLPGEQVAHLTVEDDLVSRQHCKFWWSVPRGGWVVQDLGSSNGTRLNDQLVGDVMPLHSGDTLRLGRTLVAVHIQDGTMEQLEDAMNRTQALQCPVQEGGLEHDKTLVFRAGALPTLGLDATIQAPRPLGGAAPTAHADDETIDARTAVAVPTHRTASEALVVPGQNALLRVTLVYSGGNREVLSGVAGKLEYLFGRATNAKGSVPDFPIADEHASRRHCRIHWKEGAGWLIEDLGSSNGTKVDNEDLIHAVPVYSGSTLLVGTTRLQLSFVEPGTAAQDKTTRVPAPSATASETGGGDATVRAGATVRAAATVTVGSSATVRVDRVEGSTGARAQVVKEYRPEVSESLCGLALQLIKANHLTRDEALSLADRAQTTGRTFFRILAEDGALKYRAEIFQTVSEQLRMPVLGTLEELTSSIQRPSPPWLSMAQAQRLGTVALTPEEGDEEGYRVATIDPYDLVARDAIEHLAAGHSLQWYLAYPDIFLETVQRLKSGEDASNGLDLVAVIDLEEDEKGAIRVATTDMDVPTHVNAFLQRAVVQRASDIHIEPTEAALVVRNRIDGILHEEHSLPRDLHPEVVSRIKIMSGMDVAEKRRPQDGRFGRIIKGSPIDVRVSTFPTVYGEKIVFRLLDKNALRPTPEAVGFLARDLRLLLEKLKAPYGLVMISGPTGSGKTTTLYSCLSAIDKVRKNVLTVEDPVEYRLAGVHQMQVNARIGLTFASGLRTILRQDPNVIMVGECRDAETANMAIQASLTGHVVFSTIHTNDAVGVVPRLLDMKIEPFLVATALTLAIAQRLVRKICPHCKTAVMGSRILDELEQEGITAHRLEDLGIEIDPEMEYAQGRGCERCLQNGYSGRQAVFEVFEMTSEARRIIMQENFSAEALRQHVLESGMTTLIRHGLKLVEDEVTTFQEVIRVLGEKS